MDKLIIILAYGWGAVVFMGAALLVVLAVGSLAVAIAPKRFGFPDDNSATLIPHP